MSDWPTANALESRKDEPEPTAEQRETAARLEAEFYAAYPGLRDSPGLIPATVAVVKRAQEAGEDLGLFDDKVGAFNRAEFYADVAAEMRRTGSLSGDLAAFHADPAAFRKRAGR